MRLMKKITSILLLFYYSFGILCLPMGDFSTLPDLPKMYQHCKATEDVDMTLIDFVTDHLINIDSLFDNHDNGDEQKPHKTVDFTLHHSVCQIFQEIKTIEFKNNTQFVSSNQIKISNYKNSLYSFKTISCIFRPPIVA
jgi:hypothetical protein